MSSTKFMKLNAVMLNIWSLTLEGFLFGSILWVGSNV